MKNDLGRLLRQHRGEDVRFTTMFDLYALYRDFPAMEEADKVKHLPYERVKKLEQAFAADIADTRFIAFIQLHEFEAMLFCDPTAFAIYYENCEKQIQALRDIAALVASPELIDEGQHSAPSKRIEAHFPDYPDAKPDAPIAIATMIDLTAIRTRCPHMSGWIETLERLRGV